MDDQKTGFFDSLRQLDWVCLVPSLFLFFVGIITVYSAGGGMDGRGGFFALRQVLWGGVSVGTFLFFHAVGYKKLLNLAYPIYGGILALLFVVLMVGMTVKGSQSWFYLGPARLQPSEIGKIALALLLAKHLCRYPPVTFAAFSSGALLAGLSCLLVLAQPDMGSALVYAVMIFVGLVVAGTPKRFLAGVCALGLVSLPVGWQFLKEYQKMRILVFLDPSVDPLGAGYNVIQSRIAVGSGGLWGKGFMHGLQSKLRFLPEPHTDFAFSVFSEEFGFVGTVLVLALFSLLLWRCIEVGLRSKDARAKVLVAVLSSWIWFQMAEGIGMSMGILPVTGLPLPFMSYGGSSLVALSAALGLVTSVYRTTLKSYE